MSVDDEEIGFGDIFTLYEQERQPPSPQPTFVSHIRNPKNGKGNGPSEIKIRLVGSHPLWAHHLWNSARCFADLLDDRWEDLCLGRRVLELGAGGGLPGLICALNGAETVVLTDYPDPDLLTNLAENVGLNLDAQIAPRVNVEGHIWGSSTASLVQNGRFDLIILSDLVFNHSQHDALLRTCSETLRCHKSPSNHNSPPESSWLPCLLVFYTHHRPHMANRDLDFFVKARAGGWKCEEVVTERTGVMFAGDPGDEEMRATVHGWRVWRDDGE